MSAVTSETRETSRDEPYPAEILAILALPYGLKGFKRFAKLVGLKLHPYELFILGLYFAGVRELVVLISKKNGKTTLIACLALYHLLMTENAEAVIGAASRDQATVVVDQAIKLITHADLERRPLPRRGHDAIRYTGVFEVRQGYRVIRFERGRIRVLAADADTADGVIPTLAIVDELHRHQSGALYGVLRDGLLGDAQMITISTAGASMDSPLGHLLVKAQTFAMTQVKKRRTYTSPDGSFVLVEWALDPEDNPHDMKAVKDVNPAPWHTRTTLRQRHDSPSTSTGQWLRFACGIWTEGDEPAITGAEWDRLYADIGQVRPGDTVVLAPSVGHNAAIGVASIRPDGKVAIAAEVLEARDGHSIRIDTEKRIVELCDEFDVLSVQHPVGAFLRMADALALEGVPLQEAPHSPQRLAAATGEFDKLRRAGQLIHDGDPTLRQHVLAGQIKSTETGERYLISDRARALIAVMMAVYGATAYNPEPFILTPSGAVG